MYKVSKILVPVDFSSCSRAALTHALALAPQLGATVQLLHVAEVPYFRKEPRIASDSGNTTSLQDYTLQNAKAEFDAFLDTIPAEQRRTLPQPMVEVGPARDCILGHAKRDAVDLIVMGTHGRTGRVHSMAGSVAESVVRMAPCPVLTVRDAG